MRIDLATLCSLLCVGLVACDLDALRPQPPWPSAEAVRAFDLRPIESNGTIKVFEDTAFAVGVSDACASLPWPADVAAIDETRGPQLGTAVYAILVAEADRRHPGAPENRGIADHILANMLADGAVRGRDAANRQGCEAMKPGYLAAWDEYRRWRPEGQADAPAH